MVSASKSTSPMNIVKENTKVSKRRHLDREEQDRLKWSKVIALPTEELIEELVEDVTLDNLSGNDLNNPWYAKRHELMVTYAKEFIRLNQYNVNPLSCVDLFNMLRAFSNCYWVMIEDRVKCDIRCPIVPDLRELSRRLTRSNS